MTDEKILSLMREGDERGLTAAIDKYQRLVLSIAAGMLSAKEDREEVAADTFYKVWKTADCIDTEKASLKTYICMVGRGLTINKLRQVKVTEELPEQERDIGFEVDFSTEQAAEHNRQVIAACIRELPSPEREIFIYRFYYSLTVPEIAGRLSISERRVEHLIDKTRRALRNALLKGGILL